MSKVRPRVGVTCLPWETIEEPGKGRHLLLWEKGQVGGKERGRGARVQQVMGDGLGQELEACGP